MPASIQTSQFIADWIESPFGHIDGDPWTITQNAASLIKDALERLGDDYRRTGDVSVHHTTVVEPGAVLKGPSIIGPNCFVAAGGYLRGGTYLASNCIVGPSCELKTSFMFPGSKIAHFNFVGDSILGSDVNVEAGAIIANYRNELADKQIRILFDGAPIYTGAEKFGALVADGVRIGANAVIAPGAILPVGTKVGRLSLLDQYPY